MTDPRPVRSGKDGASSPAFPAQFYPMPGYPGPPPWFPGQAPAAPAPPPPWGAAPWSPGSGFPPPVSAWASPPPVMAAAATSTTAAMPSDEYTVDTMRRIYNDDDGRVEIQRVKVQRRPPEGAGMPCPNGPEAMSVVPLGAFPLNERRPPPRKKKQLQLMQAAQGQGYPWYPYMPCMPYPVPYPYYYGGCVWSPVGPSWSSEESERTSSRQESLPTTLDSQRLESRTSDAVRGSVSPVSQRSTSPAAASHVTDPHSLAPSDSVSMRGYRRESSLERALMCPTPPPRTRSRAGSERKSSTDVGRMQDWMFDMQKAIQGAGDASSGVRKAPPRRKNRGARIVDVSDSSSLDQKDADQSSIASEDLISPELTYAFKKLEQSVDAFKTKLSNDSTPVHTPQRMPSPPPLESSGERTPTMEDASMSLDIASAEKSADDATLANSDVLSEPSSPPPLETIPSVSFSTAQLAPQTKEESAPKTEDIPSSLTTSETSSSQTSVATTLQTSEAEPKTAPSDEKKESPPSADGKPASPPTEGGAPAEAEPPTSAEKPPTSTEKLPKEPKKAPTPTEKPPEKGLATQSPTPAEVKRIQEEEVSGRESRASDSTFFSIRASDDQLLIDTDSTDILLPTTDVATTADEGDDRPDSTVASPTPIEGDEGYQWVLQQPGDIPDLAGGKEDEQRNAWRAEVSLWRARLVVSLCRGRGLDCQDWSTFHLLVRHPLTLDLKLSLLHAPRLCASNSTIGAALVRVALIHLAQYGETLLQPDASRQTGWRSIKVDPNQSWAPVKGALEILQALGYKRREEGILRYPRRSGPEVSVLARLTLDMLVLAEELRLYLTGMHQYPTNISDLFFSSTSPITTSPDSSLREPPPPRPQSSASSYSFMSAQSTASFDIRPESRASDEETDTLQASVKPAKGSKKPRRDSSSEEEVTLREELKDAKDDSVEELKGHLDMPTEEEAPLLASEVLLKKEDQRPGSTLSLPMSPADRSSLSTMTSMPDLQSIRSSTASRGSHHRPGSSSTTATNASGGNDNPEDHIYEEIDVIRAQVQALRSASVPAQSPPPLPPKKKVSSGEDDSGLSLTYPKMEWTSASTPSSLRGGSTGARKKKRRAPMPPDFMPPGWRTYQNRPLPDTDNATEDQQLSGVNEADEEEKKKKEYRRSLNPFYEDIESVKEKVKELEAEDEMNPFAAEDAKVAGYVGKNPFYEDVETLKEKKESEDKSTNNKEKEETSSSNKEESSQKQDEKLCGMGSLIELQDDSVLIKTKRKAPAPPTPTPDQTSVPVAENVETQKKADSVAESTASTAAKAPSAPPRPATPQQAQTSSSSSIPRTTSSDTQSTTTTPKGTPASQDATATPDAPKEEKQDAVETEEVKPAIPVKLRNLEKKNASAQSKTGTPKAGESQASAQPQKAVTETEKPKEKADSETADKTEEARNVVSKAIKTHQQRTQLQHPKMPPPPPPSASKPRPPSASAATEAKATEATSGTPRSVSAPPPATTPKASLAFLDEIPYMDANEVKSAEPKPAKGKDQQYEIPEPPGKVTAPAQLSPTIMRQTALLLRGSRPVPFIDESDLPPDCPPPPPPCPPPESPPETPHTSPPETPHASPPETPHASPAPSPITVQSLATPSSGGKKTESDKPTQPKDPKDATDASSQPPEKRDEPPALPPKTTHGTTASKTNKTQPEAPKTTQTKTLDDKGTKAEPSPDLRTPKGHEKAADQPSLRSSVSEDRYEIPETSLKATGTSPPEGQDASKTVVPAEEEDPAKSSGAYVPTSESDKYEVPETPKEAVVEERYEIPEVVKETALNGGASNVPRSFLGPVVSAGRSNLEAVFGPPKPPRRRRNHHSPPPPRPPKSSSLESPSSPSTSSSSSQPKLPPKSLVLRPESTTSSFSTTSGTTTGSSAPTPLSVPATPRPVKEDKSKGSRKSWPFILCDCLYANCRTYDDAK